MSAQSGKKKRMGSRRRGGNQSERSEPHEFHVKDSTSVVQASIPEESTKSLNVLSDSDYSQLETKHPPSPELLGNRRKLGSSRKSKGRQHVKDSVTESYNKPTEEVEENTSDETFVPTQMSLATQPEKQTELNQGNEHDILYVTHDSSLYSVTTPDYSSEGYNPSGSEIDLGSLIPKSEKLQAEHDQTETDGEVLSDSCNMLGGTNISDTLESAEVSDQVGQNAHHVGTSEFNSSSLHISPTVDQQLIDQLKSREMPREELPGVDSVTDIENKKRDDDTDLLKQEGNLQGNYLVSESYVKSEDVEFSTTVETTTDKSSLGENIEIEYNVERETFSLPTKELSTNEELNEHLSEVKDAQHSEDAVNEVLVQEIKPKQMQEIHQIDYSSESVIHDVTEKSDTRSENQIEQSEIRDTYQSELSVKGSDDSAPKQEISNPDENQDKHHIKERNVEALDQKNEDYRVSSTKEPWISNIAQCQVCESEGQVEDNIKPSAEQIVHQEREELLYKVKERESYLQNLQSEINAPLNSQPQDDSMSIEEETDTSFKSIGNRRKIGSSRRNKGRRHIKDPVAESYHEPTEEVVENMRGSEAFETKKMSLATEPIWQEELSQESEPEITHDNFLYSATTPGYSSEVQNLTTTNHPETILEDLIPKSGNLQANDERETESLETMLEERDKSDTSQTEDLSDQIKETSHHVGISALTSSSVHSSSTADQQLNDQPNSRETSNEELPSVYSVTDTENKERDDDTDLLRQDEILQVNHLTCESHVESEDVEFSTTPEVTTDKTGFVESTEIESNVERAAFSLPTEQLSTNEELNEHFNLSEVKDAQHSEDALNKEHEQEVKASQMQEMHQIDYSSESVLQDATENLDTHSENLIDQAEMSDTYQFELSVKSTDDSATKKELSNPDDKQDEHPIKEHNMGALNQRNEDDYVSNTNEPWISNIAPCQVYEGEGQVEDDIQPSADGTVHQVKEGILSEFEESKSSVQNQQSEINAPLDSQSHDDSVSIEEQTDTSFKPIGNRRKIGSSRRNKGRRHIKDPVAESYHEPTEEVVENMRGSEAFETTKISLSTEPVCQEELSQGEPEITHDNSLYSATTPGYSSEVQNLTTTNHPETVLEGLIPKSGNLQADDDERETDCTVMSDICESVETMLDETDKSDTPQTEDLSDQIKETSHHVGISALNSSNVHSSSTADQQLNDQPNSRETSNEELPSVYSVTDTENKERDDDTDLLRQDEILQVNHLTCESHVESEDVEFSTTPEVTTDKTGFVESTDIESNVERAAFSLPTEQLSTNEELNEHFNLSEVKDAQHSEDALNKKHKQEVKASQMQKMHQIDYSSESVLQDATENLDTHSENLIDQAEMLDTYQFELSVKSTDDSATKKEVSNPDDKQDEHPIKEHNMGALNQRNEDDYVSNTNEPWISNIAPCQVYEGEGQVEDDIQPSADGTVHQVKEGILFEFEESKSSVQNQQSEMNAPLDSQSHDDSVSIEEQTDTSFKPIGNRRKIGSSRRNKGRRHIKDPVAESYHEPTEEVVENMRGSEAFETTEISLSTEPVCQEELSQGEPEITHDNSLYSATTPGYSSEVQNLTTTNHPETVLEGLIPKSGNLQADDDERETDCTVMSDICESVETMLDETDKSDTPQTEDMSDQIKETSHHVGISALNSSSVHSSSTADQQLNDHPNSRETSNEELPSVYSVTDTENKERDDDTDLLRQDGILQVNYLTCESHVESEDVEFSTIPEVTTDKTGFVESTEIESNVERAAFSLPTEQLSTNEELNEHFNLSEVKDAQHSEDALNKEHEQEVKASQMQEMHQIDYSSESVLQDATENLDTHSENLIDQAEMSDTYQFELSVKSTDDSATKKELSNPDDKQDEHPIKEHNMGALNQRNEDDYVSNTNEPWISNIAPCQVYEGEGQVEDDIQPSADGTVHQVKEGILSEFEESKSSVQNQQSEINAPLDSQSHDDSVSIEEQTDTSFKPIGNRRKIGSSRRNKGRRNIKDPVAESYHEPTEEVVENMRGSEAFETTKISLSTEPVCQEELSQGEPEITHDNSLYSATTPDYSSEVQNLTTTNHPETVLEGLIPSGNLQADDDERETDCTVMSDVCESVETMLEERDKSDTPQTEDMSDQIKKTSHHVGISALTSSSVHSSSTADQQLNDQPNSRETSNEELPSVYSVIDTENKERDDDTELLRQDGILQFNYLTCESHVESEDVKFSTTPEITTDKTGFVESTEIESNVERATFSLPTEQLSTNEELNEHFNLSEVKDAQHSEDALNKEHEQEVKASQMQEMHQIDYSSESVLQDATENLDTHSENLIDQAEMSDTYQFEWSVKTKKELSNPDDKQDEHPIKEHNMGALNQRNEDDYVSNTNEPWISNIAPCQVYEGEGQVEDDIQPSADGTVHQVKEGILSEFEESKSSVQNQQSEINAPLDSQSHDDSVSIEEQTDTSFKPIGNRRKIGSSRRNKGRRHIKDPVAESYHEPTEEVVENMRGSEAFETTEISLSTEPVCQEELSQGEPEITHDNSLYSATTPDYSSEVQNLTTTNHPETVLEGLIAKSGNLQADDDERETDCTVMSDVCESVETMLEERDKSDTPQTEDMSDQIKETLHHVGISALTSSSVHSSSTIDQQLNDQPNSRETSNEELPSVYSVTDMENEKRDDDTDLLRQDGILQVNYLTCESHVESEDVNFSTTPEVTTDKTGFVGNTEIESNVERATFLLPTEQLSTNEELNEHYNLSEVKDAQHSEDALNKEHEQEVKASQMQEMHQIDYFSESVLQDATENLDTHSENLIDQAEMSDTYQFEWSVKTKKELSNPDDKQDEHPIKEHNMGALNQRNEDDYVSNTNEPWISNIAPCQVYEGEGQVEDDIQPSADGTVHQVKEGILSEFEESKSSVQNQQSEINAPLDSQSHDDSVSIEEQTDTSFKPIGNRRKIGSSRRNKGRRHIKDPVAESYHEPTEEVVENIRGNEVLQAMKRSLIIEATVEEKSVEIILEEMDKLGTSQTDKVSDQVKENAQEMPNEDVPNVYSVTYTENKERDEDAELLGQHGYLQGNYLVSESHVKLAKYQENTEIVYSVEKATISSPNGRLSRNEEQNEHFILAEVRDAQHSEDTVNKVHEQEDKPTQNEMDQTDYSSVKEGKSSLHTLQPGTHSPLGSLPQDDSVSIKEQTHTGINPTVNRRKMGSSRRHKGRQPVKDSVAISDMDPKDEVIENTRGDEAFETMKMSWATETTRQEEFTEQTDPGLKPTEDIKRICSTVNEEDNTQNMQEEDTILSENVKDDSVKSNEEVSENADESQQGCSENLQIKSKQKKRKLASSRRDIIRKQEKEMANKDKTEESNLHAESGIRNLGSMEVTIDVSQNEKAKLSLSTVHEDQQEMNEANTVQDHEKMGHSITSDLHMTESNTGLDDLISLLPKQSVSFSDEVVNAIKSFQAPETDPGDRNVVVSVETPPVGDDRSRETFCGTTQSDEKGLKDIKVTQEALKQTTETPGVAVADLETVKSAIKGGAEEGHKNAQADIQEPKDVTEGVHNTNFEMKNSSPNANLTNRRKKLGSSRRLQKMEVDNEATETNVGDVMTKHASGIKEKELQLQKEHKNGDSEPGKESYTEPPGHQTVEKNPAVRGQLVETEHHLTPDDIPIKLDTSPKHDVMSESAYEGRRRKLGSNRKSHGHQTETGRDVKAITDESGINTLEENRGESEVIESDKKPSSNISISNTGEPVSEKISVQHHYAEVRLGQESQKSLSLDNYKGANRYNVVMIGDSSVGKTSFMKRAQSGKFSFDLPSSVGLDSCLWNVVVDGKPVVLQLWDTAGQERFHSITRQVFHKAQAFLLMYDITSSQSFFAVRYWVDCIKDGAMDDVTVLLLGNKSDCAERQVATQEGEILAKEYNFDQMECSAATGENVVQSLEIVARLLSQKVGTTKDAVVLHKEPEQKKKSGCC